jgi:hypothetical protein
MLSSLKISKLEFNEETSKVTTGQPSSNNGVMFGIKNPSVGYSGCITVYVVFI